MVEIFSSYMQDCDTKNSLVFIFIYLDGDLSQQASQDTGPCFFVVSFLDKFQSLVLPPSDYGNIPDLSRPI
jgi:hypothetical protein